MKKKFILIGGGLISLSAIGALVCSSVTLYMSTKVNSHVSNVQSNVTALSKAYVEQESQKEDPEFVTIASSYEVKDTSAISNAYLKKDDSKLTTPEEKETLKMASDLLDTITTNKMSLYEKELAIHDWIASNIAIPNDSLSSLPTGNGPSFTPYGVLKYKKAVCVGYATTFKLLMNMLGADCMVEHNLEMSHSWDVVKLEDNQWYIVDLYTDTSYSNSKNISHKNFNVTNDYINADEPQFDTSLYPVASSTTYSYAAQNSSNLDNIKSLGKKIKSVFDQKETEAYYKLPPKTDYSYIAATIQGINNRLINGPSLDAHYVKVDKNTLILAITISYDETETDDEQSYPDLTTELDDLFGANTDSDM